MPFPALKAGDNPRTALSGHRERGLGIRGKIRKLIEIEAGDGEGTKEEKILQKALIDAENGNKDARAFVFSYLYGKPTERIVTKNTNYNVTEEERERKILQRIEQIKSGEVSC